MWRALRGALRRALRLGVTSVALAAVVVYLGGCGDGDSRPAVGDSSPSAGDGSPLAAGDGGAPPSASSVAKTPGIDTVGPVYVPCPSGYRLAKGTASNDPTQEEIDSIGECGVKCDQLDSCKGFGFDVESKQCVLKVSSSSEQESFQPCEKLVLHHLDSADAQLFRSSQFVEQTGAQFKLGDQIFLYAIGSSNLALMPWYDQLHLLLRRLGYSLPVTPAARTAEYHPRASPVCDDTKYFQHLKTTRFGRVGWSSWEFASNGWEGCDADGFRDVDGLNVKCQHGPGCVFSKNPMFVSDLATDASHSNITVLASWFNDNQHWSTHYKCFNSSKRIWIQLLPISVHMLQNTIRAIHAKNPNTWVLVMAMYPETFKHKTFQFIVQSNSQVKAAVEQEPRTFFVDYYMPNDDEGEFYQSPAHGGHPNCRGSLLMAKAAVVRLFREKILQRSLSMAAPSKANLLDGACENLNGAQCHSSALCWVGPEHDCACRAYGPGTFGGEGTTRQKKPAAATS